MATFTVRRYVPVLIHLLAWGLIGPLLLFPPRNWRVTVPDEWWIKQGLLFALLIAVFYLNQRVFVPRLLFKNRTILFTIALLGVVFGIYWLIQGIEWSLNLPELWHRAFRPNEPFDPRRERRFDSFTLLYTLLVLGISTSVAAVQKWQKDAQIRENLEREKVVSELSFLKAQINPHFFFNTLNNIYALTMIDVEMAREALHKLSQMMRYVLYETQEGTVLLSQEIAFIQNYIQLMQLRLTDKVKVVFEPPTPLHEQQIAPMLLLPFVENAFKHGVSALQPSEIRIGLQQNGANLQMQVNNTIFPKTGAPLDESNGIGLTNTRRRLDLLYANRHELLITEKTPQNEYEVTLKINL